MDLNPSTTFLPIVPVRAFPSERAELVTQMLFGELCRVIDTHGSWSRIELDADGYSGWVDVRMIEPVVDDTLSLMRGYGRSIIAAPVAEARNVMTGRTTYLTAGSVLPHCDAEHGTFAVHSHIYEVNPLSIGPVRGRITLTALRFLGIPYLWGGKSAFGMDCSGFIQTVFAIHGVRLPRDASQQAQCGTPVPFERRAAGNLAFFANGEGKIVHVGMVMDGGAVIHASGSVRLDRLDAHGIYDESRQVYTHRFHSVRAVPV